MAELAPSPLPTRDSRELDLLGEIKQTIGVLRRGWRLIGISALICLTVAIIYLARTKRIYQAEVRLLVLQQGGRHARPWRTIRSGSCLGGGSRRFA